MTLEGLIWFLLIGLIAGWLASQVMKKGLGLFGNLVIGVLGAIIGGFLFGLLGNPLGGLTVNIPLGDILVAFVGAIILLFAVSMLRR